MSTSTVACGTRSADADRLELADGIGEHRDRRILCRPAQCPVLRQELDVGDAARILLDVELARLAPGSRACARACPRTSSRRLSRRTCCSSGSRRTSSNRARAARRTRDRPRMQKRLMFPRPGLTLLVFGERIDVRHEQAALAARAQPHFDLVESSRRRVHCQQMHDPLRKAHEEKLIVDRAGRLSVS